MHLVGVSDDFVNLTNNLNLKVGY